MLVVSTLHRERERVFSRGCGMMEKKRFKLIKISRVLVDSMALENFQIKKKIESL